MWPTWIGVALFFVAVWVAVWLLDPDLRSGRAFEAALWERPAVPDAELVARFFAGSGVAPDIPGRVRRLFAEQMGYPAERLQPDDDFAFFWLELDAEPLVRGIEQEFGVALTAADVERTACTIRAVAELVGRKHAE